MAKHIKIKLTKEIWDKIKSINKEINDKIIYTSDQEHYGISDKWVIDPIDNRGDCDEIASTKQKHLKDEGIISYLTTCWTETKRYHLVCVVKTDIGDFILDNRYPFVLSFDELPYKWDKMEGEDEKWYKVI